MRQIQISNEAYKDFKEKVLGNQYYQKLKIKLSQLQLETLTFAKVLVEDLEYSCKISETAQNQLLNLCGLSQKFAKKLMADQKYDHMMFANIVEVLKTEKSRNQEITVVFSHNLELITNIYRSTADEIGDQQYFELIEATLDTSPNAYVRNIAGNSDGSLSVKIIDPNKTFAFNNMNAENFKSGIDFTRRGFNLSANFFAERLVCSNGNTVMDSVASKQITSQNDLTTLFSLIHDKTNSEVWRREFTSRIDVAMKTNASLAEVRSAEMRIRSLMHNDIADSLLLDTEFTSINRTLQAWIARDPVYSNKDYYKYLDTRLPVWDLVNIITSISSKIEQRNIQLGNTEVVNGALQIAGGKLLFDKFDLPPSSLQQIFK